LINVQQWFSLWMWIQTKQIHHNKWIIKVWSHDLGNLLRSYYYVKKVFQVVRLVINIRVKERIYSIFKNGVHIILMQRDAWYKTWYKHGVSYATLTLGNSCSVLPSIETFYSTTTEKKHSPIHGCCHKWGRVVCDKTKRWRNETIVLPNLNKFSRCYNNKNICPVLGILCVIKMTPHFLGDESGKNFRPIFEWIQYLRLEPDTSIFPCYIWPEVVLVGEIRHGCIQWV
jgi:hypothetical protein